MSSGGGGGLFHAVVVFLSVIPPSQDFLVCI